MFSDGVVILVRDTRGELLELIAPDHSILSYLIRMAMCWDALVLCQYFMPTYALIFVPTHATRSKVTCWANTKSVCS